MGCPPDPYEVSMSHSSDETQRMAEKAEMYLQHLNQAFSVIKALIRNAKIAEEYKITLETLVNEIKGLNINDIGRRFSWSDIPSTDGNPDHVDWNNISEHMTNSEKKIKQLEIALCKTRDLMIKIQKANKAELSGELSKKLEDEIALHLDHRREDKAVKLNVLKSRLEEDEKYLKTLNRDSEDYKFYEKIIGDSKIEIERISKLTDEELLTSRDVF
jgi:hypothetical protein